MVKVPQSIKINSRYYKYPLPRLNQGLWVWNLTFLGLNMATKRPNSERYQRGYWFTLALLVDLESLFLLQRVSHWGHSLTCKSHDFFCPIPVMKGGRSNSNCNLRAPTVVATSLSIKEAGGHRGEDAGWTPLDRVGLHDGWHLAPPFFSRTLPLGCRAALPRHGVSAQRARRRQKNKREGEREREGRVTTKCESFLYCGVLLQWWWVLLQQKRRDSGVPGGSKTHTTKKKVANGVIITTTIAVL
jgi:hypothetical protein